MTAILDNYPLIEQTFLPWRYYLGPAHDPYKGHVYRVFNFTREILERREVPETYGTAEEVQQRIAIAACYHDIAVWLNPTMDYLEPSCRRMELDLSKRDREGWKSEITAMIMFHHKLTPYHGEHEVLVEAFRRADLVDVSLGVMRSGVPKQYYKDVAQRFPNLGFHTGLAKALLRWGLRHPWNPLPMMKL